MFVFQRGLLALVVLAPVFVPHAGSAASSDTPADKLEWNVAVERPSGGTATQPADDSVKTPVSREELEAGFDKIIVRLEEDAKTGSDAWAGNEEQPSRYQALSDRLWKWPGDRETSRKILISELSSAKPEYRALACCMLVGNFDITVAPEIAKLLDDEAESLQQYHFPLAIQAAYTPPPPWRREPVKLFARAALGRLTSHGAGSTKEFLDWWNARDKDPDRLWYWRAKWTFSDDIPDVRYIVMSGFRVYRLDEKLAPPERYWRDVADLPSERALRVVLFTDPYWETERPYDPPTKKQIEALANFVNKHNLKKQLLEIICQRNLPSECEFQRAACRICAIGPKVFSAEDEPVLVQAQVTRKPNWAPVREIVLLRAELLPKKAPKILAEAIKQGVDSALVDRLIEISPKVAHKVLAEELRKNPAMEHEAMRLHELDPGLMQQILADALTKDPKQASIALMLVEVSGGTYGQLVKKCLAASPESLSSVAYGVERCASRAPDKLSPKFIRELAELTPDPVVGNQYGSILPDLCSAANVILGEGTISDSEMSSMILHEGIGKAMSYKVHDAKSVEEHRAIRSRLIEALKKADS